MLVLYSKLVIGTEYITTTKDTKTTKEEKMMLKPGCFSSWVVRSSYRFLPPRREERQVRITIFFAAFASLREIFRNPWLRLCRARSFVRSFENTGWRGYGHFKQNASIASFQHGVLEARLTGMSPEASLRAWMPAMHAGMTMISIFMFCGRA